MDAFDGATVAFRLRQDPCALQDRLHVERETTCPSLRMNIVMFDYFGPCSVAADDGGYGEL